MINYLYVLFVGVGVNVGLDTSLDNMQGWKGVRREARGSMKYCMTNYETSR
jgi:hypothetical protein